MADDRCDLLCLDLPRAEQIRAALDTTIAAATATRARALGLAVSRRDGKIVFYALTPTGGQLLDTLLATQAETARR
jgi:hypothetical protein